VITAADLRRAGRAELAALLSAGHPIDPDDLAGSEYRGVSLGLPRLVERLTWKKFAKAFYRDPRTGRVCGFNLRVQQDDLDRPCTPLLRRGRPVTFGRFAVSRARSGRGVELDYREAGRASPLSILRDPLVALRPGECDLLLGRSDLALGPLRVATPTYFSLERAG
jgi:hypothetical protein